MNIKTLYFLILSIFIGANAQVADLILFSYDRPLQLYALLESVQKYMAGVGQTAVICRISDARFRDGYQIVANKFPHVRFLVQGEDPRADFKALTLQAFYDSPSDYVIFGVDDIVVKDHVDLSRCIESIEKEDAYGFYLRLGDHLNNINGSNRTQPLPPLTQVHDDVLTWNFGGGKGAWAQPHTLDMAVFNKHVIELFLTEIDFYSPKTLENRWAAKTKGVMKKNGLCYGSSIVVNVSLNQEPNENLNKNMDMSPSDLLNQFLQGYKLDILPLYQIKNKSVQIEYVPTFIPRKDPLNTTGAVLADPKEAIKEKHIVIVTASYKNAEWYKWNLDSVFNQNYKNWHMIYVDDCSPDGTGKLVREYVKECGFEDKVTVLCNKNRRKALANLYTAIMMCAPTDIIAILDGDDRLASADVLKEVNFMYSVRDIWLTYGQFREYPSGKAGFCKSYPREVVQYGAFRNYPMGPSHLRTFYAGLFHKIKLEDLCYEGDFFPMTYDLAIMFPMIEMAREHFMFCETPLVDYNTSNPINDHKVSQELQRKCDAIIRSRGQYSKLTSLFDTEKN